MSGYRKRWTVEHGEDGLRPKFAVYKRADRFDPDGVRAVRRIDGPVDAFTRRARIGEGGEFVFVLRPHSDEAAWTALLRYAELVRARAPRLAADIEERLRDIYVDQQWEPARASPSNPDTAGAWYASTEPGSHA
jgi:hypothetical protein